MKNILKFLTRKYIWAVVMVIVLSLSTTYTLLDAFVIPKAYTIVSQSNNENSLANSPSEVDNIEETDTEIADRQESSDETSDIPTNTEDETQINEETSEEIVAVTTDYSYSDENISINVEKLDENGTVFYVADIQVTDISYLKTAFANGTFGKNITQDTSEMAEENNAIFAINGDYYGFRDTGLIIRNGILYRDIARNSSDNEALTINSAGELGIVTEGDVSGESLVEDGILQAFSFGPVLVEDGQIVSTSSTKVSQRNNPRTAIGQISPLHYIVIVADGRTSESDGMSLETLAQEFVERGATVAYNLDGGGSSTMWLNGQVINNPTDGRHAGERSVSDILYIGY